MPALEQAEGFKVTRHIKLLGADRIPGEIIDGDVVRDGMSAMTLAVLTEGGEKCLEPQWPAGTAMDDEDRDALRAMIVEVVSEQIEAILPAIRDSVVKAMADGAEAAIVTPPKGKGRGSNPRGKGGTFVKQES